MPWLTFDFGADTRHGDTGPRAGFAFNMYCLAASGLPVPPGIPTVPCNTGYDLTLDNAERQSRETGDALLLTEFGPTDDLATTERIAELADRRMISWQQWHHCPCDDPTTAANPISTQAIRRRHRLPKLPGRPGRRHPRRRRDRRHTPATTWSAAARVTTGSTAAAART